jgi:hypothetical protein
MIALEVNDSSLGQTFCVRTVQRHFCCLFRDVNWSLNSEGTRCGGYLSSVGYQQSWYSSLNLTTKGEICNCSNPCADLSQVGRESMPSAVWGSAPPGSTSIDLFLNSSRPLYPLKPQFYLQTPSVIMSTKSATTSSLHATGVKYGETTQYRGIQYATLDNAFSEPQVRAYPYGDDVNAKAFGYGNPSSPHQYFLTKDVCMLVPAPSPSPTPVRWSRD